MKDFARRQFLRSAGGAVIGLPALDLFRAHEARGQGVRRKIYSVFMMQQNGVVQETFWPSNPGPLSDALMGGADAGRSTSELRGYASKLTMVKGMRLAFSGNGCGHSGGCNQALTAARVSDTPRGNKSLAMGESIDNRIARELTPDREPFALYAGRKPAFIGDAMSYRGALQVRAADNNPWTAYQRLVGLNSMATSDPTQARLLVARRKSVNDVLRGEIKSLLSRKDLSMQDRQRLDLHFTSVRDIEINLTKQLGAKDVEGLQSVSTRYMDNDLMPQVTRLQLDLIAFALASDLARTSTLQVGSGTDGTQYIINGVKLPNFHQISHRIYSDGTSGAPIPDAVTMHHNIDRLHGQHFKYLLDKLSAYTLPEGGTLLDSTIAVWMNSLANGPPHGYHPVPYILAGSGGGFFKTGQFVDVKSVNNNKLFNSILTASGLRKPNGDGIDNFGDPSLAPGLLTQIHA